MSIKKESEQLEKDIQDILKNYSLEILETDKDIEVTKLYLIDKKGLKELLVLENAFNNSISDLKRANHDTDKFLKKYGFQRSCKILNPLDVAYKYSITIQKKFKLINDREKVYNKLEEEFEVWKNSYLKYSLQEFEKSNTVDKDFIQLQQKEIFKKIALKQKKLIWLKDKKNFDTLDVRISSRDRSKEYATLYYYYNIENEEKPKMHRRKFHLDIQRPNVLWYEEKEDKSHNSFMKNAENAFGDVYFIEN